MKLRSSKGHSQQQQKLYEAQLKKDGVDLRDKVWLKKQRG